MGKIADIKIYLAGLVNKSINLSTLQSKLTALIYYSTFSEFVETR